MASCTLQASVASKHWQTYARKLAAFAYMSIMQRRGEHEEVERIWEMHQYREAQLLALDRAIEAVCEEHGFDVEGVRRLSGTTRFVTHRENAVPDATYQAAMQSTLSAVLSGCALPQRAGEKNRLMQ